MNVASAIQVEPVLVQGFAVMASLWLLSSSWVVVDRVRFDRRKRRLRRLERALADPTLEAMRPLERAATVRHLLAKVPKDGVYQMTGNAELPAFVREVCAEMSLEHVGLMPMLRDATPHKGARRKWRRISALHALERARPDAIHALLRVALADADPDVASAAATVLQRIGDLRAAEILVGGLRAARLPASRIAARLERFPIPIDDVLRPLLIDQRAEARYWGATLLRTHFDRQGLGALLPLVDDHDASVRKAALLTLGTMKAESAARLATRRLGDPAPFVRSAAIHVLAQVGERSPDRARRQSLASAISPLLADRDWSVRATAKDALARLGPTTWREVAAQLSSSDEFARNGAAEVLQNLGVLDWTLRGIASGARPTDEAVEVLRKALREGGVAMANATAMRASSEPIAGVRELIRTLQLEEAAS
jgi:HEAT repeat protein